MRFTDDIDLVDRTGKQVRKNRRGKIGSNLPPALARPGIYPEQRLYITQNVESEFKGLVESAYR